MAYNQKKLIIFAINIKTSTLKKQSSMNIYKHIQMKQEMKLLKPLKNTKLVKQ